MHCTKTGILPVCLSVQGRTVRMNIPVRIVPGFGGSILPECFFLQKHFRVDKQYDTVTVNSPDDNIVLAGKALHYNPGSWLFYVSLPLGNNKNIQNNTTQTPECTYAIVAEDEAELRALLPVAEGYDSVYALMASANPKTVTQLAQLKLWHERLGHADFTKVASILGLPAPSPPPACLTCMHGC